MSKRWSSAAAALAALMLLPPTPIRAMTPEDQAAVERGLDALYMSDYDGAERVFQESLRSRPGDPVLSLGRATASWWRMENDFAPPKSPEERTFVDDVNRAIGDGQRETGGGDKAEAYLCLGAAYGLRGRWEAARHHWVDAYLDGRRAYGDEAKAVKLNPELYDAYLGLGAFDYYLATISRFVRAFAFASGGGRDKGLSELHLAEQGRYGAVAAKLLLVQIDWTFEKNPQAAWSIIEDLHRKYPDSPMVDTMRLIGLFHLRNGPDLEREARDFLDKAERGAPFFRPIDKSAGRYFLGLGEQLSGKYAEALAEYEAALNDVPPEHPWRSMLHLFIGECQDLLGRRQDAVTSYKQALKDSPLWGVPRYTRHLLKRPFRPGDNPLPARSDDLP